MPAGDLLEEPGQIEWAGLLFDIRPSSSGLWLSLTTDVSQGWQFERTSTDQDTEAGAAPGKRIPAPMYPTIIGLCAETAEDVMDVLMAMAGEDAEPLCWYDRPTNRKLSATAVPRRCAPSNATRVQLMPHRLVDLQWLIMRPAEIEVLDEEASA